MWSKVTLSLYCDNQSQRHEDTEGNGGITPRIRVLDTILRRVASSTLRRSTTGTNQDRRVAGPQRGVGGCREEKHLLPVPGIEIRYLHHQEKQA